jgi:hypothetical protein
MDWKQRAQSIAIAVEGLLRDDGRKPIAQTLATRAAWLLGTDPAHRDQVSSFMHQLYEIRSDLVHTGGKEWERDLGKTRMRTTSEAIKLYGQLISKILRDDPKWSEVVPDAAWPPKNN